ncbi:hypothetical protein [Thermoactinospora rubra]|uniref:hypothetical protein n=1 Tax=Thermoactinospora rubra TaxID=1088767 RepID=UPI000A1154EC|nr:hypothetical protein [Thermoactinospora rubra]
MTTTTTTTVPAGHATNAPVSDVTPDTPAEAVWNAVAANPGATLPAIAEAAGVTRAVVKAELAALADAGRVTCVPGGHGDNGRRLPDTWAPVLPAADAAMVDASDGDAGENTDEASDPTSEPKVTVSPDTIAEAMRIMAEEAERRAAAEAELQQRLAEEEARRAKILAELEKARTTENTRRALADLLAAVTSTYAAVVAGDDAATTAGLELIFAGTESVRAATGAAPARATRTHTGNGGGSGFRAGRAAPRPLRPEVIAHLRAHPNADFTPGEIARVLDRSSGAVANALDTLVKSGEAVMTGERPARYRLAPAGTDGDAAASGTPATDDGMGAAAAG